MSIVATGDPIDAAPYPEYHEEEHVDVVHEVVDHGHESSEITAAAGDFNVGENLTVIGDVTADDVSAINTVSAPSVVVDTATVHGVLNCSSIDANSPGIITCTTINASGDVSANYLESQGDIHTEHGTITAHALSVGSQVNCASLINTANLLFVGNPGTTMHISNKYL